MESSIKQADKKYGWHPYKLVKLRRTCNFMLHDAMASHAFKARIMYSFAFQQKTPESLFVPAG
jgi:hypothetical protein